MVSRDVKYFFVQCHFSLVDFKMCCMSQSLFIIVSCDVEIQVSGVNSFCHFLL